MIRVHKTARAAVVVLVAVMVAAACTPTWTGGGGTGGGGTPVGNSYQFGADRLTVIHHNDSGLYGSTDEPYVYNIWFRVRIGAPGSADAGVAGSRADALSAIGDGQSAALTGAQRSAVDFNNVKLLDVPDLLDSSNHLELVGVWSWAMDKDDVGVAGLADSTASVLKNGIGNRPEFASSASSPRRTSVMMAGEMRAVTLWLGGAMLVLGGMYFAFVHRHMKAKDSSPAGPGPL